ncbi:FAD-dependent oxidoreductase [Saccharothrix algeriensis]|uniref:FAD-dependent oxidoreductase n=1 Tax=Saccharothrix algeriensis TaxID=173560 RepID=A0A8T8HYT6_9PSEU|nr:FAD-dependent oxidoreductase [Saccharothrix algeriensis]MBM7809246.1 oxygen-dependent protoporphyrinogen oxidase [Saccharothrix algeriensis]QTR03598.1 FAD-dependent oxidoreductase [Saccharothrix algeriensis]
MSTDVDVVVVGAGVAGLTAAHELRKAGRRVCVLEAADRVGGRMATTRQDGFVIDTGAEQLSERGYDATWALLAELGVGPSELPRIGQWAGVWRDGRFRRGLAHPLGLITGAGLSARARLDLIGVLRDRYDFDRPEEAGAETVAGFAARHHPDLLDYLCQPVVAGFCGWDPERSAAGPFLALLTSIGPSSGWRAYRGGTDLLARVLAERLDVGLSCPVDEVVAGSLSARVFAGSTEVRARSVVLAVPAPVVRRIYANPPAHEVPFLAASTYVPVVKVHLVLDRRLSAGVYLGVVPRVASRTLASVLFDHLKHPDRAPAGRGLVTLVAHPSVAGRLLAAPDGEAADVLVTAAEEFVPGLRAATTGVVVHRFRDGLPEATPRALALRAGFAARAGGVVDYAGDWVGVMPSSEAAVRSGRRAAARVLAARRKERV